MGKRIIATGDTQVRYIDPAHAWEVVAAGGAINLAKELGWQPNDVEKHYNSMALVGAYKFIANFIALPFAGVNDE